ncbi:MAG: virion morphogenesis family protein [Bacteriophage sp.]|nr:MAG: virion morphogenesis family protein [Bacteriophage sp.]UVM91542.1 MAG: virion morphogenesis family protein [Bacteriophage sp.]UVN01818.1 MAG: virion morphogenesis family protein [Bacteriophage sp.]UVX34516.1 MAG: virion morphogenesis family protein [Bacteriophage sp.]UVX36029.1 MAG: virion morphogenesis family protein [Bacteriophage sp.]
MSMANKNYVDFKEAYKAINKTEKQLEKAQRESLIKAGEYAANTLEKNTPYYDGKKYQRNKGGAYDKEHAKDHVVTSKPTKNKPLVEVGYDSDVSWRMHFVEYGTIKQRPQPFMKKTMKDIENEVATIIQKEMQRRLKG